MWERPPHPHAKNIQCPRRGKTSLEQAGGTLEMEKGKEMEPCGLGKPGDL